MYSYPRRWWRSALLLIALTITAATSFAQHAIRFEALELPAGYGFNDYGIELSSITKVDEDFYALSEKCKLLYKLQIDGSEVTVKSVISLAEQPAWKGAVAIEGVAAYGKYLIMADEGVDSSKTAYGRLYAYHLDSKTLDVLKVDDRIRYMGGWTGNYGPEGIAVHPRNAILYVVREKDREGNYATLLTFSITEENNKLSLSPKDTVLIERKAGERFSDLTIDPEGERLHLLRSEYYKQSKSPQDSSRYSVCTVSLDSTGQLTQTKESIINLGQMQCSEFGKELLDRTQRLQARGKQTSTNVEGITWLDEGTYLIVSDNANANKCDYHNVGQTGVFGLSFQ
jgi:hypothetical protein